MEPARNNVVEAMGERILMQVSGQVRPLEFSPAGSMLSSGSVPQWRGVPMEVQQLRDWEGDVNVGPLRGSLGLLVYLSGQVEFLARGARRDQSWVVRAGDSSLISGDECPRILACRGTARVAAVDLSSAWVSAATGAEQPALSSTMALGSQASIVRHVQALVRYIEQPLRDPLAAEGLSLDLLSTMLSAMPSARARDLEGRFTPATCRRLQEYVREHLAESITLAELAEVAGCSPRRFSTLFKETFGVTPHKYVMRCRLMEAARLLRTSRLDLVEIAYEVGFSSQSHFSTAFHSGFGVRPRDYARYWRRQIAWIAPR